MKYYYDCPISAAYMAKHFGVVTQDKGGDIIGIGVMQWEARNDAERERYYIHPDSMAIFEPKVGDRLIDKYGFCRKILSAESYKNALHEGGDLAMCHCFSINEVNEWSKNGEELKIIHRQGKAFIWPWEEA